MKNKSFVLVSVAALVILTGIYDFGWAKTDSESNYAKIGTISIRRIFEGCKKNIDYRNKAQEEQQKAVNLLKKLNTEIQAAKAGLETLKPDSKEYTELIRETLQKEAQLQAEKKFYENYLAEQDKVWTEKLYIDIVRIAGEIAKEKDLDIVLENDEPEFPVPNSNELMLLIRTRTVIYSAGCTDISDAVIERLDEATKEN